jgi:hypothetical protein
MLDSDVAMEPLDGVKVQMATSFDDVTANIRATFKRGYTGIEQLPEWRQQIPVALVGGGPSLKKTIEGLRDYRYVMACGSVHDFLVANGIRPNWTVISDPDPVMAQYLRRPVARCNYLVASYCHEAIFKALSKHDVSIWHPNGGGVDFEALGFVGAPQIGGGCTVATRAVSIALCFGFQHIHLFGMDTCVPNREDHHAYDYETENEQLGPSRLIQLEPEGPRFLVPDYLLAQLYDFKFLIETYPGQLELRVAGGGLIDELLKVAVKARKAKEC